MAGLEKPLSILNDWLEENELELDLIIIGAYALHLHGISSRMTMDVDTITTIKDAQIKQKINEIGKDFGISSWLNDQADNVVMPEGFETRLKMVDQYSTLHLSIVSRIDLIKLKVAAYFYRKEYEDKDFEDILRLNPTKDELQGAIEFLKSAHLPDTKAFKGEFYQNVKELHEELKSSI